MFMSRASGASSTLAKDSTSLLRRRLRALIDQATEESEDESDEHASLLSTVRDEVACPFPAIFGGEEVECVRLEFPRIGYGLNAVCNSRGTIKSVDISKLELVEPLPRGHEWIEAYFAWRDLVS